MGFYQVKYFKILKVFINFFETRLEHFEKGRKKKIQLSETDFFHPSRKRSKLIKKKKIFNILGTFFFLNIC